MTSLPANQVLRDALGGDLASRSAEGLARALADDASGRGPAWQLVRAANLVPLVAILLEAQGLTARLSPSQADYLADAARTNAARQALLVRRALEATRMLAADGITAAWIKGAWMAACVCERPAMRVMEDLDLVVPADALDRATALLEREGLVAAPSGLVDDRIPARTLERRDAIPGSDGSLRIDLHHGFAITVDRLWPAASFWAATRPWTVRGGDITGVTHAAGLLLAALHAFKHGYDTRHQWMAIADAAAIVRAAGTSLDAGWLEAQCAEPHVAVALYLLLALCPRGMFVDGAPITEVRAAASRSVDVLGARNTADTILRHASHLSPIGAADFSLMAIGEQASPWGAARQLLMAMSRRRRRDTHGDEPLRSRLARLARANWRYAYTTFRVGRLASRIDRSRPR